MPPDLTIVRTYKHPVWRVWGAITEPASMQRWLGPTDFLPRAGHVFTVQVPAAPGFNGVVVGEVIEVEAPRRLRMFWRGGPVESHVCIELEESGLGTQLRLTQTGFDKPEHEALYAIMMPFWAKALSEGLRGTLAPVAAVGGLSVLPWLAGMAALMVGTVGLVLCIGWMGQVGGGEPVGGGAGAEGVGGEPEGPEADGAAAAAEEGAEGGTEGGQANDQVVEDGAVEDRRPTLFDDDAPVVEAQAGVTTFQVTVDALGALPAHAQNPTWSLDGRTLAVEMNTMGSDGISLWFVPIDGAQPRVQEAKRIGLPGSGGGSGRGQVAMNPTWHPEGLAVFEGSNAGGKFRLYFAVPGGASAAQMLDTTVAPGNLQFPVIAPNGKLMAYTSDQFGKSDIMTWDRGTSRIRQQTRTPALSEVSPAFDPTGGGVVFTRPVGNGHAIFRVDLASWAEATVVAEPGDQVRPTFANGDVVYFTSERGAGRWDVARIGVDGTRKTILARNVRLPERSRPAVSPDGKYLAYVHDSADSWDDVYVIDLGSGTRFRVQTGMNTAGEAALTERGDRYLLAYTVLSNGSSDWRQLKVADLTDLLGQR